MRDSVDLNFEVGGRPLWVQRRMDSTGDPLRRTGALRSSKHSSYGSDFAEVTMGEGLGKYPFAQQFGSQHQVRVTNDARRFFWAMFHSTGETKWKYMAMTDKQMFTIKIPARPFILFQEEDIDNILGLVANNIFKFTGLTETELRSSQSIS